MLCGMGDVARWRDELRESCCRAVEPSWSRASKSRRLGKPLLSRLQGGHYCLALPDKSRMLLLPRSEGYPRLSTRVFCQ